MEHHYLAAQSRCGSNAEHGRAYHCALPILNLRYDRGMRVLITTESDGSMPNG
jgi:hypothetical protein